MARARAWLVRPTPAVSLASSCGWRPEATTTRLSEGSVPHVAATHQDVQVATLEVEEDQGRGVARTQRTGADRLVARVGFVHLRFAHSIHGVTLVH
jgi:hypothetical protein